MRLSAVFYEARRRIASGTARTVVFALLLSAATLGLLVADLSVVHSITRAATEFRTSGASVLILAAPGRIDGAACESLAQLPTVRAAGAIRELPDGFTAAALPSSKVPAIEVSEGALAVLYAETTPHPGVVVSDQLAEVLAVAAGDVIATATSAVPVRGSYIYPDDGRRPGLGYAVLIPVHPEDVFDECWVDAWPMTQELPAIIQTTLLEARGDDEQQTLSQLNTRFGERFDGATRFSERITRFAMPTLAVLAAALGYLAVRLRRIELASELHVGAGKRELAAILGIEIAVWVSIAAGWAGIVTVIVARLGHPADASAIYTLGTLYIAITMLAPFAGAALALLLTKERQLFRYFKDR